MQSKISKIDLILKLADHIHYINRDKKYWEYYRAKFYEYDFDDIDFIELGYSLKYVIFRNCKFKNCKFNETDDVYFIDCVFA